MPASIAGESLSTRRPTKTTTRTRCKRDEGAGRDDLQRARIGDRLGDGAAGDGADAGEEEDCPQLAQRQVRGVRHLPHERAGPPECAEDEAGHERAAGDAEGEVIAAREARC